MASYRNGGADRRGERRLPDSNSDMDELPSSLRCHRNDGKEWQCRLRIAEGSIFCPKHTAYYKQKNSSMHRKWQLKNPSIKKTNVMQTAEMKPRVKKKKKAAQAVEMEPQVKKRGRPSKLSKLESLHPSRLDKSSTSHEGGARSQSNTGNSSALTSSKADLSLVMAVKSRKRRKREEWADTEKENANGVRKKRRLKDLQASGLKKQMKDKITRVDEAHSGKLSSGITPVENGSRWKTQGYDTNSQDSSPSTSSPIPDTKGRMRTRERKLSNVPVNGTRRSKHNRTIADTATNASLHRGKLNKPVKDENQSQISDSLKKPFQKLSSSRMLGTERTVIKNQNAVKDEQEKEFSALLDEELPSDDAERKGRPTSNHGVIMPVKMLKGKNPDSKMCHQCQRNDKGKVVYCSNCETKRFCLPCLSKWYPLMTHEEIERLCPVCRKNCNCKACLRMNMPIDKRLTENVEKVSDSERVSVLHYMLSYVAPIIKQLHEAQHKEVLVEMALKGSIAQIESCELNADERLYWSVPCVICVY